MQRSESRKSSRLRQISCVFIFALTPKTASKIRLHSVYATRTLDPNAMRCVQPPLQVHSLPSRTDPTTHGYFCAFGSPTMSALRVRVSDILSRSATLVLHLILVRGISACQSPHRGPKLAMIQSKVSCRASSAVLRGAQGWTIGFVLITTKR